MEIHRFNLLENNPKIDIGDTIQEWIFGVLWECQIIDIDKDSHMIDVLPIKMIEKHEKIKYYSIEQLELLKEIYLSKFSQNDKEDWYVSTYTANNYGCSRFIEELKNGTLDKFLSKK